MKRINLKESLLEIDKQTDFKYTLTDLYEACMLEDDDKKKLVQYVEDKDIPAMSAMLSNAAGVMSENVSDDLSDDEVTLVEDDTMSLHRASNLEDIEYIMSYEMPDCIVYDGDVEGEYKCAYHNGVSVNVKFNPDASGYVYTIDGKGPYETRSSETVKFDITRALDKKCWNEDLPDGAPIDTINEDVQFNSGDMVFVKPAKKLGRVVSVNGDNVEVEVQGGTDPDRKDTYYKNDLEVQDTVEEGWNPDMTDCPSCGDISFDSKKGRCTRCSYRESWFDDEDEESEYEFVSRKYVTDSDGFQTEYTWYKAPDGLNVFVFGDSDFYRPEDGNFDYEEESDHIAQQWFDSYNGFDDLDEKVITESDDDGVVFYNFLDARGRSVEDMEEVEVTDDAQAIMAGKSNPQVITVTKFINGSSKPDEVLWERESDKWYVSRYIGGAEYEPAEGGYYYETLTLDDSLEFSTKEEAIEALKEIVAEYDEGELVYQDDVEARFKLGKYVGDCEELYVEREPGIHASGKQVYEDLNEAILKEDVQNTPVKLASEYFYDTIKNIQDAGWSEILSFAEDSGWINGSNIIIPAGTVMTLVDQNRHFDVYWVKTSAGDEFIPFNKDFTAESPLSFESTEGLNNYRVTFYMDSLDDNVMSGPSTTKMICASSEEEAKKKLIDSSTDKYYIPTVTKVELVESVETSKEWEHKDKDGKIGRIRQSDGKGDRKPLTSDQAKEIAKFRGHEEDELYPVNEAMNVGPLKNDFMPDFADYDRWDRIPDDEEAHTIAPICYMFGVTWNKAHELLPTLSAEEVEDAKVYYNLRDLPSHERLAQFDKYEKSKKHVNESKSINEDANDEFSLSKHREHDLEMQLYSITSNYVTELVDLSKRHGVTIETYDRFKSIFDQRRLPCNNFWWELYNSMMNNSKSIKEDSYGFKNGNRYYGGLPSEGSDIEYAKLISNAASSEDKFLAKYGVKKHTSTSYDSGQDVYTGSINGHDFEYIEGNSFPNKRWVSKLVIDNKEVDTHKSRGKPDSWAPIDRSFCIGDLIDMLSNDRLDTIVFKQSSSEVKKTSPLYSFTRSLTYSGYFTPNDILRELKKIRNRDYYKYPNVEIETRLLSGGSYPCIEEKYIGPKDELVAFMRAVGLNSNFDKDIKLEQPTNESKSIDEAYTEDPRELMRNKRLDGAQFDEETGQWLRTDYNHCGEPIELDDHEYARVDGRKLQEEIEQKSVAGENVAPSYFCFQYQQEKKPGNLIESVSEESISNMKDGEEKVFDLNNGAKFETFTKLHVLKKSDDLYSIWHSDDDGSEIANEIKYSTLKNTLYWINKDTN